MVMVSGNGGDSFGGVGIDSYFPDITSSETKFSAHLSGNTLHVSGSASVTQVGDKIYVNNYNALPFDLSESQVFQAQDIKEIIVAENDKGSSVFLSIGEEGKSNTIQHVKMQGGKGNDNFKIETDGDFSGVNFDVDGGDGDNKITYLAGMQEHNNTFNLRNASIDLRDITTSKFVIENPDNVIASTTLCQTASQIDITDVDGSNADEYTLSGPLITNIKSDGNNNISAINNAKLTINSNALDSEYIKHGFANFVGNSTSIPIGLPVHIEAVSSDSFSEYKYAKQITFGSSQQESINNILAAANGRPIGSLAMQSHANAGFMSLFGRGNAAVDINSLDIKEWSRLRGHFGSSGQIELGGCHVASGDAGKAFLQKLAVTTGVPVSAGITIQTSLTPGLEGTRVTAYPDGRVVAEVKPLDDSKINTEYRDFTGELAPGIETHTSAWQKFWSFNWFD